jgi:hypothetical protein
MASLNSWASECGLWAILALVESVGHCGTIFIGWTPGKTKRRLLSPSTSHLLLEVS